ncbi:(Fe-S)-binding protein [Jiella marina]|uniref:(Fe-S)-binding protein n=1 Tax=Jiella sp. LLJ827 TaxID=2917712 RepID=UPI00210182C4|nr:(Fe-S)-binding protein [Jiella sp. LLJ827]MCQ0986668.1 (Fe-S)-binding protein [Jiella sp. LLJ827]
MTPAAFLPWLVVAMVAVAAVQLGRRVALWRSGRPAKVDWVAGLKALPKRYLVDVHHVVDRDKSASRMHVPVAGGLVAASGLLVLGLIPALAASQLYWAVVTLAFLIMAAGVVLVGRRRYPRAMKRLSLGRWQRFPVYLGAFALGGILTSALAAFGNPVPAIAFLTFVVAAAGGLMLAYEVATGPMRHALAGATHLVAHPRAARFEGSRETGLRPIDLEGDKLGNETPQDFAWNRLLSFDACVQCGRCEAACPAFAAGQPLSPKHLIADLAAAQAGGHARPYAGMPYPNERPVAGSAGLHARIVSPEGMIHPDTLWSCTTCRACVEECPMMIEHVDAIVDMRRFQTLELGAIPLKAEEPLGHYRGCDEPNGRALSERTDFAAGLSLPRIAETGETDILLWLGQAAYDLRGQRTLRALIQTLNAAGVEFAVLGAEERDCGDLARRLGDEATFQRLARQNIATLSAYRFRRILTADPHALHVLRNEYPAFGGDFPVIHHTAFLSELIAEKRLSPASLAARAITYHDPCYLGRYNGETEAPRSLIDALGLERREMARSGKRSMCCGGGGGAPSTDIPGDTRIPDIRMSQARETGASVVAVACPQCTAMLEGVTGERPDVKDIAELVWEAVQAGSKATASTSAARELEPA